MTFETACLLASSIAFIILHLTEILFRDVTRHLQLLLRREGLIFRTSSEMEIVRSIKEKACYVALKPKKEEHTELEQQSKKNYVLPDGEQVHIGASKFRAPEVLFNPNLIGDEGFGMRSQHPPDYHARDCTLNRGSLQESMSRSCTRSVNRIWTCAAHFTPT